MAPFSGERSAFVIAVAPYSGERAPLVILEGGGSFCSGCLWVGLKWFKGRGDLDRSMESPGVKTRGVERGWFRRRLVCFRDPMKRVFSLMLFRRCCGGDGQVEAVVLCVALTEQSSPRLQPPWFVLRPDRTEMERGGGRTS
ncbi:hypothetical protein Rs2_16385 [Raphanus sativus]|nr:hypothetical protein Rs2_16385 [Raphanus sativus]